MIITKRITVIAISLLISALGYSAHLIFREKPFAKIKFESSGCFHFERLELTLVKSDSSIIARLDSSGKRLEEQNLSKAQMDTINEFMKKLRKLKDDGGCTTVDVYDVNYDGEKIKKYDGTCDWRGFRKLTLALFNSD
jgi:hypothetical protein